MFVNFIQENELQVAGGLGNTPSYKNGSYTARLDFILMSECIATGVTNFLVVHDVRNISDHKLLSISIQTGCNTTSNSWQQPPSTARQAIHRFKRKGSVFVQHHRQELETLFYLSRALTRSSPINKSTSLKPRRAQFFLLTCANFKRWQLEKWTFFSKVDI